MITVELLKLKGASARQVALFAEIFPEGAVVKVKTAIAVAAKFNWEWAAENLLSSDGFAAYNTAISPAADARNAATKAASDTCNAVVWPAHWAYNHTIKVARAARTVAIRAASNTYEAGGFALDNDAYIAAINSVHGVLDAASKSASEVYTAAATPAKEALGVAVKAASETFAVARATAFAEIYISENVK
jgi:hypothetical protein